MIRCKYEVDDHHIKISLKGHAGYAPIGQDIVCAGVSALWNTFIDTVNEYIAINDINEIHILSPSDEVRICFQMLIRGIMLIAVEFPDYVSVQS